MGRGEEKLQTLNLSPFLSGWALVEARGTPVSDSGAPLDAAPKCPFYTLKFRRVTIRGAQPSARLSEEICLSEVGVSQRALQGLSEVSAGSLRGLCGVPQDFPRFFGGSDPALVTLENCWIYKLEHRENTVIFHLPSCAGLMRHQMQHGQR